MATKSRRRFGTMRTFPKARHARSLPGWRRIRYHDEQGRRCTRFEVRWWARFVPGWFNNWWQRRYLWAFVSTRPLSAAEKAYGAKLAERLRSEGKMP